MRAVPLRVCRREAVAEPVHRPSQVENPEQDQHQRDREFQCESEPRRNCHAEKDNRGADGEDGKRVADSPEDADPPSTRDGPFAADNGGDRNDVVGIGGMAHAEEEADSEDEEDARHEEKPFKV